MKTIYMLVSAVLIHFTGTAQEIQINGIWTLAGTKWEFNFSSVIEVSNSGFAKGYIDWGVKTVDPSGWEYYKNRTKAKAREFIEGTFSPHDMTLKIHGVSKDDPSEIIQMDDYELWLIAPSVVNGKAKGGATGKWDGRLSGEYKATGITSQRDTRKANSLSDSKDELIIAMIRDKAKGLCQTVTSILNTYKEVGNFRVIDRQSDGNPRRLRFDYIVGHYLYGKWSNLKTLQVDVIFKGNLPVTIYYPVYEGYKYAAFPYAAFCQCENYKETVATIHNQHREFLKELRESSPSYIAVKKKHDSYPAEYNIKNCLAIVKEKGYFYGIEWVDNPDWGDGLPGLTRHREQLVTRVGDISYLKNISNHPIVIKGIYRKSTGGDPEYFDQSIKLEPGQTTDFFKIYNAFDDLSRFNVQFIGDTGEIKEIK